MLYPLSYRPNIGVTGFEPAASCSQSRRSTKLSYTPKSKKAGDEARTRDPDLGKVVLYQLSYSRRCGGYISMKR